MDGWMANKKWLLQKKGKREVQGVPQSQTAVLPRHQEEKETNKSKQAQIEQTALRLALSSPSEVIAIPSITQVNLKHKILFVLCLTAPLKLKHYKIYILYDGGQHNLLEYL